MIRHREMTRKDLCVVLDWAAAEGWNPGLDDADPFLNTDPAGFFVAEDNGEPVAAISVVNHSGTFAFLGLYLCKPSHRGRGIGYDLWQHAMRHAGDRTIGLDGVPDQQANYLKSGFVHAGATTRYSGVISGESDAGASVATLEDIPDLIDMEANASGWRKEAFLSSWFRSGRHRTTYLLRDAKGPIEAMATIRSCQSGAKVGPLIATDESKALAMLRHVAADRETDLIIDVPSTSVGLETICIREGLSPGFNTARMYRGHSKAPTSEFYAVATLELG